MNSQAVSGLYEASSKSFAIEQNQQTSIDIQILSSLNEEQQSAEAAYSEISMDDVYKSLTAFGDKIISGLEEAMGDALPEGGIRGLDPANHTPEKTAQRIVTGITALLPAFASQNPNLKGEELLDAFMTTVKGGVEKGFEDAMKTLEAVGALEVGGVEEGVYQTMNLVKEKLSAFEDSIRIFLEAERGSTENAAGGTGEANQETKAKEGVGA